MSEDKLNKTNLNEIKHSTPGAKEIFEKALPGRQLPSSLTSQEATPSASATPATPAASTTSSSQTSGTGNASTQTTQTGGE